MQHGPDSLLQHPPQPGDLSNEENPEDFDDWVDNLYGFVHLLNPPVPTSTSAQLLCAFVMEQTHQQPKDTVDVDHADPPIQYYQVPWLWKATLSDKRLEATHDWLVHFEQPPNTNDHEYALIICYASGFFIDDYIL